MKSKNASSLRNLLIIGKSLYISQSPLTFWCVINNPSSINSVKSTY